MSLPRRMKKQRDRDRQLERELRITRNDPIADQFGGVTYSPTDIKEMEREKLRHVRAYVRAKRWLEETGS